ncbi:MAG: hypothetical protein ACXACD_21875, partial [Candidatus Thorarchaeota archaeon]
SDVHTVRLEFPSAPTDEFLLEAASNAEIVVGWRPTREFLDAACKMRLFINPGAGVQHHLEPFRELNKTRKVILVNGHGNSYFTAQHAVALLLALMNKITPHHNWMAEGHWRRTTIGWLKGIGAEEMTMARPSHLETGPLDYSGMDT